MKILDENNSMNLDSNYNWDEILSLDKIVISISNSDDGKYLYIDTTIIVDDILEEMKEKFNFIYDVKDNDFLKDLEVLSYLSFKFHKETLNSEKKKFEFIKKNIVADFDIFYA